MWTPLGRPARPPAPIHTPLPATDSLSPCSPQTSPSFCSWSGFILCPEPLHPSRRAACSAEWRNSHLLGRTVFLLFLTLLLNPNARPQNIPIQCPASFHPHQPHTNPSLTQPVIT